jgi:hypothetical protein
MLPVPRAIHRRLLAAAVDATVHRASLLLPLEAGHASLVSGRGD